MFGYSGSPGRGDRRARRSNRVHPEDQARLIESWIAMVATVTAADDARLRMRRDDDRYLWVDLPTTTDLGEQNDGYVLAECIDVSAEMAAQEALQDREELLRRLLEEMPNGCSPELICRAPSSTTTRGCSRSFPSRPS